MNCTKHFDIYKKKNPSEYNAEDFPHSLCSCGGGGIRHTKTSEPPGKRKYNEWGRGDKRDRGSMIHFVKMCKRCSYSDTSIPPVVVGIQFDEPLRKYIIILVLLYCVSFFPIKMNAGNNEVISIFPLTFHFTLYYVHGKTATSRSQPFPLNLQVFACKPF